MDLWRYVKYLLLALTLLHAASWTSVVIEKFAIRDGLLIAADEPIAGDFVNLYAAARLTLTGREAEIYPPADFMACERSLIPAEIGVRQWAYPPHSLLLTWPFGLGGFFASLAAWSARGLGLLVWGARRLGLGWVGVAVLALSPSALHCLYYGQTGNHMTGLMLVALSTRRRTDAISGLAAALATIKPQVGFLLPLLWLIERRFRLIALTAAIALALVGLSLLLWGPTLWSDYVFKSLALLQRVEREAYGWFVFMIPSLFMSGRVLGLDADLALLVHGLFAVAVLALLVWRLVVVTDPRLRIAMLLIATPLISPYMHSYDLTLLTAGGLIVGGACIRGLSPSGLLVALLVVAVWGLPNFVLSLNQAGWPASPLLILALFLVAAFPQLAVARFPSTHVRLEGRP